MSTRLLKLARTADGRYFQPEERDQFLAYADSLPRRFQTSEAVSQREEAIVSAVINEMQRRYPNFAKFHDQGWAKCYRDLQLVLRHDAQAVIIDDVQALDDRILLWLRSMLAANNLTPKFCHDAFGLLREQAQAQLPAESYELIRPYLDRNVDVLSDFAEPAAPAV